MTKLHMLLFGLGCYCLLSCNSGNNNESSTKKEEEKTFDKEWAKSFIDSLNKTFSEQIAGGDSSALASHYWPDAELLLDNSESFKGNDIINAWGSLIRMGAKMSFTTTDITGDPQYIIETGNYEMKSDKNQLIDKGKYVVVWQKRNNEWKLYRDIGCTSMPAAK